MAKEVIYEACKRGHTMTALYLCSTSLLREFMKNPSQNAQLLMAANGRCDDSPLGSPTPKWAASIQEKMRSGDW